MANQAKHFFGQTVSDLKQQLERTNRRWMVFRASTVESMYFLFP